MGPRAGLQNTVGYENQSVIGIVIGYGLEEEGSNTGRGNRYRDQFFSLSPELKQTWSLIIHLHLVLASEVPRSVHL